MKNIHCQVTAELEAGQSPFVASPVGLKTG
jgi:hypothetical protein